MLKNSMKLCIFLANPQMKTALVHFCTRMCEFGSYAEFHCLEVQDYYQVKSTKLRNAKTNFPEKLHSNFSELLYLFTNSLYQEKYVFSCAMQKGESKRWKLVTTATASYFVCDSVKMFEIVKL